MEGKELISLAERAAKALHSVVYTGITKSSAKSTLLKALLSTDFSVADFATIEKMPSFSEKWMEAIGRAESKGLPLLRNPSGPTTEGNVLRETDTYNLFISLLCFKLTCETIKRLGASQS